jgi:hypothetical protein
MIDQEVANEVIDKMIEELGEDKFEELQMQTYCYRILTSIYYCASTDPIIIAKDIIRSFGDIVEVPLEFQDNIKSIVEHYLPMVVGDPSIMVDGILTANAITIAQHHNKFLNLGYTKKKLH